MRKQNLSPDVASRQLLRKALGQTVAKAMLPFFSASPATGEAAQPKALPQALTPNERPGKVLGHSEARHGEVPAIR